ncbi:MAG: hypothetical protein HKN95_06365 [Acidimicrobiia bacterium]|nr:hypothetical protein [Acidimicrobiia bacterium]
MIPDGIALDADGSIYVADVGASAVKRIFQRASRSGLERR